MAELGLTHGPLPDPVGSRRSRASRPAGFRLDGRSPGDASRARHQGDRRPPPPRLRPAIYRSARSRFPEEARRLRRPGRGTLSVDRDVDSGQRAADDRALFRSLRPSGIRTAATIRPSFGRSSTNARARWRRCGPSGRAIPAARLLQTEDLGKTFATAPLAYQADHENERRWLSLDLLDGRVDSQPSLAFEAAGRRHRGRRDRGVRRRRGPAGHARDQPLSDQRALPRPSPPFLPLASAGRERPRHLCRRRSGAGGEAGGGHRPRAAAAGGLGALRASRSRSPRSITAATATSNCAGSRRPGRRRDGSGAKGWTCAR